MLISALCQQDPAAAALLLQQARGRNHQLRSTFFDDGGYAEGAWAYHAMAMDGLICYALIAEGAFGQSLAAGTSASHRQTVAQSTNGLVASAIFLVGIAVVAAVLAALRGRTRLNTDPTLTAEG